VAALAGGIFLTRRSNRASMGVAASVACVAALESAVFLLVYPTLDAEKSPRPIAERAASLSAPGAPIGVYDHPAMAGGLAYYAGRRVVSLSSPERALAFLEAGEHAMVIKARKLERLDASGALLVRDAFRSGSRRVLVLTGAPRRPDRRGDSP
jgi:hypothetical protein